MKSILRSIFLMPGVIIHELSHHLFCIIFRVKVIDFCYYNFKDSSGYVLHNRPKHLYQEILISISPFFINSFLGGLVAYPTIINKLSLTGLWFRLNDKVQRLKQLIVLGHEDEVGESEQDTFQDLSIYGIIAQIVSAKKWGK